MSAIVFITDLLRHVWPQGLQFLGISAALLLALAIVIWLAGVRVAHPALALAAAAGGLAAGYFVAAPALQLAPLTGALIGLGLGIAVGFFGFRFMQAGLIAAAVALVAGSAYFGAYVHKPDNSLLMDMSQLPATRQQAPGVAAFLEQAHARYEQIAPDDRRAIALVGGGAALVAFLVAVAVPRATTLVASAAGGAALVLLCSGLLIRIYMATQAQHFPTQASSLLMLWAVLAFIGLAVQYRFFSRSADKSSQTAGQAALRPA